MMLRNPVASVSIPAMLGCSLTGAWTVQGFSPIGAFK